MIGCIRAMAPYVPAVGTEDAEGFVTRPAGGHDAAAWAGAVTDDATGSAVRSDASTPRIATRAAIDRPRHRSMR